MVDEYFRLFIGGRGKGIGFSSHTSGDGFSLHSGETKSQVNSEQLSNRPFLGRFLCASIFAVRINVKYLILQQMTEAMILGDRFGAIRTMGRCDSLLSLR